MQNGAAGLAARLARNAEMVCRHYLSNGRREGHYWLAGDANNAPGRSLYVRLRGPDSGKGAAGNWTDSATGQHGDLLDIIRLSCNFETITNAMYEARRFLALPVIGTPNPISVPRSSQEVARRLYAMGQPIRGTLAKTYLRRRGITADLSSAPLRFHPSCYHRRNEYGPRKALPALLAAVTDLAGAITGVHRTWLDPALAIKAQLPTPRKAMGNLLGNGVRFGVVHDVLVVGEGLETVLSLRTVLPQMPMIAALSANHLAALRLPAGLRRLYVARDNDAAGQHAVEILRHRRDLREIDVRELVPVGGDFNDDLRQFGAAALIEAVTAQLVPWDVVQFVELNRR